MKELFGAGTACVVCPINKILFNGEVNETLPNTYNIGQCSYEMSARLYI